MVYLGLGWDAVLIGAATVAAVASLVVGADRRISADSQLHLEFCIRTDASVLE